MKTEVIYSLDKFRNAAARLEEGLQQAVNQLDEDGVIQRFEFTFELMWKTLKLFLLDQGIITKSPKEVLQETFRYGLIQNEDLFLNKLEDRNQTSRIYSEDVSNMIFNRIKMNYMSAIKKLLTNLEKDIAK